MSMTKYGKYESDGILSTKLMRWTMVDEMNGMDFEHSKNRVVVR